MLKRSQLSKTTSKLKTNTQLKRSPMTVKAVNGLRKGGKLKKSSKSTEEQEEVRIANNEAIQKMWELFNKHYEIKLHRCESCTAPIWGENLTIYHHHILEKGVDRYKHLAYKIDNLMLLCTTCHCNVTNGNPSVKVIARTQWAHKHFNV